MKEFAAVVMMENDFPSSGDPSCHVDQIPVSAMCGESFRKILNVQVTLTPVTLTGGIMIPATANTPDSPGEFPAVTTGVDGRFAFNNLKPAIYGVTASTDDLIPS